MQYYIAIIIFNLFFHPLSRFPGPKPWAAARLPYILAFHQGFLVQRIQGLHEKYGNVVRIAPDELSFIDAAAMRDVYGSSPGIEAFRRNPLWYGVLPGKSASIVSSSERDHVRMRRLISHGFSDKALREQEPLVVGMVDLLIRRLHEQARAGDVIEIVKWYNFVTFDVIGDLIFGEPFHCLQESHYHPWVSIVCNYAKAMSLFHTSNFYLALKALIVRCIPESVLRKQRLYDQMNKEKLHERLNLESERPDIIGYIKQFNDEKGMTISELEDSLAILIMAGSETTATALSGITNCLLRNKSVLQRLTDDIRKAYRDEKAMTMMSLAEQAYLNAVINEGLRLCPPAPAGLSRLVPKGGGLVCGHHLPEGVTHRLPFVSKALTPSFQTTVSYHTWSAHRSESNFNHPSEFLPDRWLPPTTTESPFATDVKDAFGPFSLGRNSCLGRNLAYAEMRLILARLVWSFDIEFPGHLSECPNWWEQKMFLLTEKEPLHVRLRPVNK